MTKNCAVLFDLDGVLVLTEPLKAEAHSATIKALGGNVEPTLYLKLVGQSHEKVRSAFLMSAGMTDIEPEQYTRLYRKTYEDLLRAKLKITPGAKELLEQLSGKGYHLAVISSTNSEAMTYILNQTSIARFFDVFVSSGDVQHKKPAPDAYLLALKLLRLPAISTIVIEDSTVGVQAAISAGIRVLALRHSFNGKHDFTGAVAVLDSFFDTSGIVQVIDSMFVTGGR